MTVSKDLLFALLSLDAYNRGFGAGLEDRETGLTNEGIGSATIQRREDLGVDKQIYDQWKDVGFHAEAYDTPYGTVIAYRGTDFSPGDDISADAGHGWPVGGGNFFSLQALHAVNFLDAVQPDDAPGSVALTGHSLGGGLAGFNAELFGNEPRLYDPMTYIKAVNNVRDYASRAEGILDPIDPELFVDLPDVAEINLIDVLIGGPISALTDIISVEQARHWANYILRPSLAGSTAPRRDDGEFDRVEASQQNGFYLPGEILDTVGFEHELVNFDTLRDAGLYPNVRTAGTTNREQNIADVGGGPIGAELSLHSMSALVLQIYSDERSHSSRWEVLHPEVFEAWFTNKVADTLRPESLDFFPEGFESSTVTTMIAYSAVNGGHLVFGDTGIRAMFDDLVELGVAYTYANRDALLNDDLDDTSFLNPFSSDTEVRQAFADIAVQYAGALAHREVTRADDGRARGADATQGVFGMVDGGHVLALDLSMILWDEVLRTGENGKAGGLDPLHRASFAETYYDNQTFEGTLDWVLGDSADHLAMLDTLADLVWEPTSPAGGAGNNAWRASDVIDRFHMRVPADLYNVRMSDRSYALDDGTQSGGDVHVDIYSGTTENDHVSGTRGNDVVFGLEGNDTLVQRGGRDVLALGEGANDRIIDYLPVDPRFSPNPDRVLRDAVFIGGAFDGALRGHFDTWVTGGGGTATVQYDVFDTSGGADDARFPPLGLRVTDLQLTTFGEVEGVLLTLENLNASDTTPETDLLVGIERVELTQNADTLAPNGDGFRDTPLLIDMGGFSQGWANDPVEITSGDFDVLSYARSQTHNRCAFY